MDIRMEFSQITVLYMYMCMWLHLYTCLIIIHCCCSVLKRTDNSSEITSDKGHNTITSSGLYPPTLIANYTSHAHLINDNQLKLHDNYV